MPEKSPYSDARREQHGQASVIDNPPANSVNEALSNSKSAVDQAKAK